MLDRIAECDGRVDSKVTALLSSLTDGIAKVQVLTLSAGQLKLTTTPGKVGWAPKAMAGSATAPILKNTGDSQLITSSNAVVWTGTRSNSGG